MCVLGRVRVGARLKSLTAICREIQISVESNFFIIDGVVPSTYSSLLFLLAVITPRVVAASHVTIM